ncbi:MAG: hypothetical protein QM811_29070 [Pirellulales bacterium]
MPLRDETQSALDALGLFAHDHRDLDTASGDAGLHAVISSSDRLAVGFDEFRVTRFSWAVQPLGKLKTIADVLARRLSYLLEPIGTIEVDGEQCVVQMRSIPPAKDAEGINYYELLVQRGGVLSLVRYRKTPQTERTVIPAMVTREVFLRLVEDFGSAVG